jgi:hypothetical protein
MPELAMAGKALLDAQPAPPALAYFWGQDAYGLERAARELAAELSAAAGQPLEVWRTSG